jgi:S-adenosylmethionine decarboxylase proenzyme
MVLELEMVEPMEMPQAVAEAPEYVAQGRHLMLTMRGCPSELLNDEVFLKDLVQRAVLATGAGLLNITSHQFEPQGVTILALLSESHASVHTYPESGVMFWDCFTCGWHCDPTKSVEILTDALKPTATNWECIVRGDWFDNEHIEGNGG